MSNVIISAGLVGDALVAPKASGGRSVSRMAMSVSALSTSNWR